MITGCTYLILSEHVFIALKTLYFSAALDTSARKSKFVLSNLGC